MVSNLGSGRCSIGSVWSEKNNAMRSAGPGKFIPLTFFAPHDEGELTKDATFINQAGGLFLIAGGREGSVPFVGTIHHINVQFVAHGHVDILRIMRENALTCIKGYKWRRSARNIGNRYTTISLDFLPPYNIHLYHFILLVLSYYKILSDF